MILCLKKINAIIVNVYKFPHLISEKNNSPSLCWYMRFPTMGVYWMEEVQLPLDVNIHAWYKYQ